MALSSCSTTGSMSTSMAFSSVNTSLARARASTSCCQLSETYLSTFSTMPWARAMSSSSMVLSPLTQSSLSTARISLPQAASTSSWVAVASSSTALASVMAS